MAEYYLVEFANGPDWERSRPRREQAGFDEHAAFMDELTEEGFIVLGGPVGLGENEHGLLLIAASSEAEVRARLAPDPWLNTILTIDSLRPWSLWLRAPATP